MQWLRGGIQIFYLWCSERRQYPKVQKHVVCLYLLIKERFFLMNIFSFFSFLPFFFFVNIVSYTAFYVKRWLGYFFWYLFKEFYMAPPKKEKTPQTFREIYMLLIFRFNHDNIVTCSRDGSAIIWIPRSRRSHVSTFPFLL